MINRTIINYYRDVHVTEWAYFAPTNTKFSDKYSSKNILIQNLLLLYYFGMYGLFQSGAPVPSYYEITLESLDGHKDLVTNITVERNGDMIAMHVEESVPPNSLWRASILAYGCESDRIVANYELSKLESKFSRVCYGYGDTFVKGTHDIQNIVAISQLPGQISVTGELISGSTATGVLVVVYSLTNSEDIHYIAKQTEGNIISLDVTGLTGAEYGVSTFALENGLPLPSVVTSPKNITVLNGHQG